MTIYDVDDICDVDEADVDDVCDAHEVDLDNLGNVEEEDIICNEKLNLEAIFSEKILYRSFLGKKQSTYI